MTLEPWIAITGLATDTIYLHPTDAMRLGGLVWMLAADAAADEALVRALREIETPLDGIATILQMFRDQRGTIREEGR